jgi:hypothetical protein
MKALHYTGGEVLVHCKASLSRSAVFCLAYLMKHHSMSAVEAAKFMKPKWDATWPCDRFAFQVNRALTEPYGAFMEP